MGETARELADGFHLLRLEKLRLAVLERRLGALALGDVSQRDPARRRAVGHRRGGGVHVRPERSSVAFHHPQLVRLRFAGLDEFPAVLEVDILVVSEDEPGPRFRDERSASDAQHRRGRQVGLPDHALVADGEVADRGEVVEVEVPRPRVLQFRLRPAQFLVLHLELDLMDVKFVEQLGHRVCRQPRRAARRPGRQAPDRLLGPGAQLRPGPFAVTPGGYRGRARLGRLRRLRRSGRKLLDFPAGRRLRRSRWAHVGAGRARIFGRPRSTFLRGHRCPLFG